MQSQNRFFREERQRLLSDKPLNNSSTLLALFPFLGLSNSSLTQSQKHPPILSGDDHVTKLLFSSVHLSLCHCGPSLLLSHTGVPCPSHGCQKTCQDYVPQLCHLPQDLCQERNPDDGTAASHPSHLFTITGIDYAGPFTMKKGYTRKPVLIKTYLAVFVCFSTKAAHLEVVSDL